MSPPIIFMAFANDPNQPLPGLEKESEEIYRTLTEGAKKQFFQLHREPFATTEKIAHYLIEFKDQVSIFHYGGHADSEELVLLDEQADAKGIAQLLKAQSNLKLVFLNGCSTQQQVKLLLELGIPAVIATSSPINDDKATLFAEQFYKALAKDHTINEAFGMASGFLQAKGGKAEHFRGFQTRQEESDMPWGMYTNSDEVMTWKLPQETANKKQIIIRQAGDQFNFSKSPVNTRLTKMLISALRPYSKKMEFLFASMEDEEEIDERLLNREIIDSLPAPIGEQVRKLFSLEATPDQLDKIGLPRLEQLVKTHQTLLEFIAIILLADIWEIKLKKDDLSVSSQMQAHIRSLIARTKEESNQFNTSEWIKTSLEWLEEVELLQPSPSLLFVEELPDLHKVFKEDESFQASADFMEEMRQEVLQGKVLAEEIESFCVQAEEHLSNLFSHYAFCARYKLNSIKRIVIQKSRNKSARFSHYKVKLDTITAGYKDVIKDYESGFTEDKSVILLKEEKILGTYLNLSPFLIDENALKDEEKSKLFFFNWYEREKDVIHYKYSDVQKDELKLTNQYPELREQFEEFSQLFFGKSLKEI